MPQRKSGGTPSRPICRFENPQVNVKLLKFTGYLLHAVM